MDGSEDRGGQMRANMGMGGWEQAQGWVRARAGDG